MRKHNPENERIKRRYLQFLREAKRLDPKTIDKVAAAINRFEDSNKFRSFKKFHIEQAVAFKRKLNQETGLTGKLQSKATIAAASRALKAFFQWLSEQPGYRSRISYSDAEYFNPSAKDARIASAIRLRPSPTMQQALHALRSMPAETDLQRRDRAILAFLLLTGARDGAIISLKLKHIDLIEGCVYQDARDVNTKASKTFTTWFFPVDALAHIIFQDWMQHLRDNLGWGQDLPLFPATDTGLGTSGQFEALKLSRSHWTSTGPIRRIVKSSFKNIGLPEFRPHSFRHLLARFGMETCKTLEELKGWSENLGHEHLETTTQSYGTLGPARQSAIMKGMTKNIDAT